MCLGRGENKLDFLFASGSEFYASGMRFTPKLLFAVKELYKIPFSVYFQTTVLSDLRVFRVLTYLIKMTVSKALTAYFYDITKNEET